MGNSLRRSKSQGLRSLYDNTPVELRDTLWWFNYTKEQGGVKYLVENRFKGRFHESTCSDKTYRSELTRYRNMEKLVRWNVDLSNEITSSVYLITTSSGNQAYLSARSMKIRKKGSKDWMKPRQKILRQMIKDSANVQDI